MKVITLGITSNFYILISCSLQQHHSHHYQHTSAGSQNLCNNRFKKNAIFVKGSSLTECKIRMLGLYLALALMPNSLCDNFYLNTYGHNDRAQFSYSSKFNPVKYLYQQKPHTKLGCHTT
jgi:hypothetical protein